MLVVCKKDEDEMPMRTGLVCCFVFFADWSEQRAQFRVHILIDQTRRKRYCGEVQKIDNGAVS